MTTVERCPGPAAGPDFDPFDPAFLADPYPWFAFYRERHPVFYGRELDYWVLSRYQDVKTALPAHRFGGAGLHPGRAARRRMR